MKEPQIYPIASPAEGDLLQKAALEDGHGVPCPTHVIWRPGDGEQQEIVGGLSLAGPPLVMLWFHSKKVQARQTLALVNSYENFLRLRGFGGYIIPCSPTSPFYPNMESRFGGLPLARGMDIFYKPLTQGSFNVRK